MPGEEASPQPTQEELGAAMSSLILCCLATQSCNAVFYCARGPNSAADLRLCDSRRQHVRCAPQDHANLCSRSFFSAAVMQNAYTSFDETVYELHVPVSESANVRQCLSLAFRLPHCFFRRLSLLFHSLFTASSGGCRPEAPGVAADPQAVGRLDPDIRRGCRGRAVDRDGAPLTFSGLSSNKMALITSDCGEM